MIENKDTVYSITYSILQKLDNSRDTSSTKALLANIRNSIDKGFTANIDALAYIFANLPDEYLGNSRELSIYEESILTALQMYAIHQQANTNSILKVKYEKNERKQDIGEAFSAIRVNESESIDKRFNSMITSGNFRELRHHLRQMIKLLKSRSDVKVDYAKLAEDLYWFMIGRKDEVRLRWARSYYKYRKKEEMKGDIQNEK